MRVVRFDTGARSRRGEVRGDKERRSVPSERGRGCADRVNGKLTAKVNLAVVVIVMNVRRVTLSGLEVAHRGPVEGVELVPGPRDRAV